MSDTAALKRPLVLAASLAVVAGSGIALAAPTQAALTTRCVGEGGAVTVPGDLVVPRGKSCTLTGTVVQGDVTVRPGADLITTDATLEGTVTLRPDAYLDVLTSSVGGDLVARRAYGATVSSSSVDGDYRSRAGADLTPFLSADDSVISGSISSTGGALELLSSTAGSSVSATDGQYADVLDSVVEGDLDAAGNLEGALVCDSEIYGAASFSVNTAGVQLGGEIGIFPCEGSSYWGSDVSVDDTSGGVWVTDNIVRGDLSGDGNDPAPVGEGNRVRGTVSGQFAELSAPASMRSLSSSSSNEAQQERNTLEQQREQRKAQAERAAAKAGPADL